METPPRYWNRALVPAMVVLSLTVDSCAPLEPTPPEPVLPMHALRPLPPMKAVPGAEQSMQEATIHVEKLTQTRGRLEIRTIVLRPRVDATFRADGDVMLEVRGGAVESVINGVRARYYPGDIWLIPSDSRVVLNGVSQAVVLRAIYLVREQ
jgi:hypothetical protein